MKDLENVTIVQVAYHRNGVSGEGFHAVIFTIDYQSCAICGTAWGWTRGDGTMTCDNQHDGPPKTEARKMVASVFPSPGHVAVYAIAELSNPEIGIAFGENSWRGDRYEARLRQAIREERSDGSVQVGPFAIPTKRKVKST
jgi:hypothetical protein